MKKFNLLASVLVLIASLSIHAQTTASYIGTNTNWFEPTNWDTGTVPDATTDIVLNNVQVLINPALSPTGSVQVNDVNMHGGKLTLMDNSVFRYNAMTLDNEALLETHSSDLVGDSLTINNAGTYFNPTTNDTRSIVIIAKTDTVKMFLGGTIAASSGNVGMGNYATLLSDDVELNGQLTVESIYGFNPTVGDTFQIVTARNSLTGTFDNAREGDTVARMNGLSLQISYAGGDGNDVVLTAVEDNAIPIDDIRAHAQAVAVDNIAFMQSFNSTQRKAGVTFATVGGAACEFSTIQEAVDSARDEVRIVTNTIFNENVFVSDLSVKLRGGFSTCAQADADNQGSDKSQIVGIPNTSEPVIAITGNNQRNTIVLENLDLTGGTGGNFLTGGGISTLNSNAAVLLRNLDIHDNHSKTGGGIAIQGTQNTDTDFMLIDTLVYNNTSSALGGGGLYCNGSTSSVVVVGESGFSFNTAITDPNVLQTGIGGGVYVKESCQFSMYSGTSQSSNSNLVGIAFNTANAGGGIEVGTGSVATLNGHKMCSIDQGQEVCIGNNTQPININNNTTINNGGGVGVGGQLSIFAGLIDSNSVSNASGGGIVVAAQAELNIGRLYKACWHQQNCSWIKDNKTSGSGGAIWTINHNITNVFSTTIEGNRALEGTAIFSEFTDLKIENSLIIGNGNGGIGGFEDRTVIKTLIANNFGSTNITHTTIADNNITTSILSMRDDFSIRSSIIHEVNGAPLVQADIVGYSRLGVVDCLIANETSSLSLTANISVNNTQVIDPQFIDRANGDYHLADNSPAIDLCANANGIQRDIDFETRGWDDTNVPNHNNDPLFIYDAGVDETFGSDIIFKHGFELD